MKAALWFVAVWQAVVMATGVPPFILPPPLSVAQALVAHAGPLGMDALVTLSEIVPGLLIGGLLGMALAMIMCLHQPTRRALQPVLAASQAVPVFALSPILSLWLGFGLAPKVAVVVLIVFFPIASAFHDGLEATPEGTLDLGRIAKAGRWRVLWLLRVPHALPVLGSALRIAVVYAPIGAVTGEWLGSSAGLGHAMLMANARSQTDTMFAALAVLTAMTVILRRLADALPRREVG